MPLNDVSRISVIHEEFNRISCRLYWLPKPNFKKKCIFKNCINNSLFHKVNRNQVFTLSASEESRILMYDTPRLRQFNINFFTRTFTNSTSSVNSSKRSDFRAFDTSINKTTQYQPVQTLLTFTYNTLSNFVWFTCYKYLQLFFRYYQFKSTYYILKFFSVLTLAVKPKKTKQPRLANCTRSYLLTN